MLSYLYVLKVSAVCGLAPLAFQSVTAVGWLLEGQRPSLSSISVPLSVYLYNISCSRQLSQLRNKSYTSRIVILSC